MGRTGHKGESGAKYQLMVFAKKSVCVAGCVCVCVCVCVDTCI